MKQETYIVDGRRFKTFEEVENYCEKYKFRITNTQIMRKGVYLISVHGIDYAKQLKSIL